MTSPTELESFMKVIEASVGRELERIYYYDSLLEGSEYRDRLAYIENITLNEEQYKHYRYLPKLHIRFGKNPNDKFINPFGLAIYCTWHILRNAKSICSYVGLHDTDGLLKSNLALIQGHLITQASFIPDKLNLFLEFDNHLWLALFPNNLGFNVGVRSGFWHIYNKELGYRYIASSY